MSAETAKRETAIAVNGCLCRDGRRVGGVLNPRQFFCKVAMAFEVQPRPNSGDAPRREECHQGREGLAGAESRRALQVKPFILEKRDISVKCPPDFDIPIKGFIAAVESFKLMNLNA